ncbi:MAG: EAL domain-containing protein, partial [Sulfurimonas sp.]|nr:EAL domain-containing protein [Sulfurimonas sp.]
GTKIKNDYSLELFIQHAKLNIKRIEKFSEIRNLQNQDKTSESVNKLYKFLTDNYQDNLFIEKIIIIILFSVALMILSILIIMNRRAITMRNELLGFRAAIENSYNSIVITDVDSKITYVNEITEMETGYSRDELIGQNPRILKSGMNDESFYKELHESLKNGQKWDGEFINKKKDGSLLYEKASIMPIYQDEELVNYIAIKLNITDYVQEKEKVEYIAYHDSLTSLPNRINIEEYVKNRLPIVHRENSKLAILFIDLDRFKVINDTLGHDVGDDLLVECSKRIKKCLRESDMLARVGGDEFIVVIESPNNDYSAAYVCEKILNLFKEPIQTKTNTLNITLSIGVSIYPDDAKEYNKLLKYADIAMYEAKNSGKNTYCYYQKKLSIDAHNRLDIEQSLKVAKENSELYMVYQPKYDIANKTVIGLEALVRWENDKIGFISPDKFIPIAEDTGFIIDIGLFIFEQSCRDFLIFKQNSKTLETISINISTVQLYQETFVSEIMKIIENVGISINEIKLEITETHIMKNINYSIKLLKELKELGFSISVDDFGTGHSSLSYLKLFPIDELKIDKSFVDDLPHDKNDVAIAKAIITLSQTMGYVNVAEGIENEEQEKFLRENGCDIGQGYYFCKPKRKDDLISFLLSK